MNDVSIALEHVDLLNRLDRLHIKLLQRRLQLLVIGAGALVDLLDFSPGRTLATITSKLVTSSSYGVCMHCAVKAQRPCARVEQRASLGAVGVEMKRTLRFMLAFVMEKMRSLAWLYSAAVTRVRVTYRCAPRPASWQALRNP